MNVFNDRSVIKLSGPDSTKFLQSIVTNDVTQKSDYIYALILTPQGKILYDLFIHRINEVEYDLDIPKAQSADMIKLMKMYKLRSNVDIQDFSAEKKVVGCLSESSHGLKPDPRHTELGFRGIVDSNIDIASLEDMNVYHIKRISLKIPDYSMDLASATAKFFPLELALDKCNAISYTKGCYIGQEVTARVHYRGTVRKKLEVIEADKPYSLHSEFLPGSMALGMIQIADKALGLALVRDEV